jgi:hypothetical protein
MTEFKLCEEMGLLVAAKGFYREGAYLIPASDVEKMLEGGKQTRAVDYYIKETGTSGLGTPIYSKNIELVLSIPQKPKPVTKEEIISFSKNIPTKATFLTDEIKELFKRIEKAGIE